MADQYEARASKAFQDSFTRNRTAVVLSIPNPELTRLADEPDMVTRGRHLGQLIDRVGRSAVAAALKESGH